MAESSNQSPQQAALQRLLQADADAQARRQEAHTRASQILAEGEQDAQQILDRARSAAEAEAKSLKEQTHQQAQADAEEARQTAQQAVAEMNRLAREHWGDAVALLVAWVKAEA